jgi:peptidoglycan-associated lipoprotein
VPEIATQEEAKEEAKVPEIAPQEEAKIVSREEVKVYAPKEEAKVPEIAPKEERKVEARPEEKPAPFDLAGLRIQFAFDDFNLSSKAKGNLEKVASWMSKNPAAKIQIEGHTCEIGTNEYNLALGERRANSAKRYLEGLGVSSRRISTISYGEERPLDPGHTEDARSKNRRDEFVATR